ncbi:hypothetical protein GGQ80_000789 [Sphingomonas jinjuensis]|uniref:Uncharacterized protein n=1 Tax=Sphingomonas jinjuensis TaxID=535907 RepID=A0A840F8M4_9SPHN|nr:hypothetical protein [Sphingomonas jinjuensis]
MGVMMDAFGWTAEQYWTATSHEIWALVEAREAANKRQR